MKIIDFIRLLQKHFVLLAVIPILLAIVVILLTRNPDYKYSSSTTLFTGIATGSSIEMDKSFNYFATNMSFDNLINIIGSRKTQEEVAVRLLSQHLLLEEPDPKFISAKSFNELRRLTPAYIYKYVATEKSVSELEHARKNSLVPDTVSVANFAFDSTDDSLCVTIPPHISDKVYEQTVLNLTKLMDSSDTNFVYKLLNFPNPHYSIKDVSSIKALRIGSSDLVQLKYEADDPGICQQTLAIMTKVCVRNYRGMKENRSDAVVKYFEYQLKQASAKLKIAEEKLLEFNKGNNIINYYEQSKAVAIVKEDLDVDCNAKRVKLAGLEAASKRIEEKMGLQEKVQLKSSRLLEIRSELGEVNYRIAVIESNRGNTNENELEQLKATSEKLTKELKTAVNELYLFGNTAEGLPVSSMMNEWIATVIEAENTRAGIKVLEQQIKEFQKQYAIYAPAGANIKRIEREISVSEQEFLEILHGLNLAKLKLQDNELSSNIKVVDKPYYPLSPIPGKRKILVLLAAVVGFILTLAIILAIEYFDQTLKHSTKAEKITGIKSLGMIPKILLKSPEVPVILLATRLIGIIVQRIDLFLKQTDCSDKVKVLLFFSTQKNEGKTVIAGNLALSLKNNGRKVLYLNYSEQSLPSDFSMPKTIDNKYVESEKPVISAAKQKPPFVNLLLGYPDPRVDLDSPFIKHPEEYLEKHEYAEYQYDEQINKGAEDIHKFIGRYAESGYSPDYVLIEIPSIIDYSYPIQFVSGADMPILVCRSNRVWTEADQSALQTLQGFTDKESRFVLNGVDLQVVESVLGELPKKRSRARRIFKKFVLFQFLSKSYI